MFKKPTKKQFIIRRIILSSIATLSVIIIATVAILFMLGYRLDSGNGRLEQGALLQFDSRPNGADVWIDGKNIGSRTATKQTVVSGVHTIKMSKAGYEDWQRTVGLAAGTLTWLDYTLMVPTNRPVQAVATYQTLTNLRFSPDNKWAVAQEKADTPTFQLVDLRSEQVKSTPITLPQAAYSEATTEGMAHSFTVESWDSGGRYLLVKHLYSSNTEWLVVDTQNPAQAVNVTRLLSASFKDLQFASTNGKVLYGLTNDGTIRKVDLSAETLSRGFVTHAESFDIFDNTVLSYIGSDPNDASKQIAGVYRDGDEAAHTLRSVPISQETPLKIAVSQYFGNYYIAIAEGNVVTVLKGNYPSSSSQDTSSLAQFTQLKLSGAVSALSISPKGEYVFAQSGENFASYEIEYKRAAQGTVAIGENSSATSTLKWLDAAHLWNDDKSTLVMRDFNGINTYPIMSVEPGYDATLSQNGRFFYAVGKDDKGYHLQRVKMILD